MTTERKPEYRFKFQIVDETTGEVVAADWTIITDARIDQFGGCETVDIHVGCALRNFQKFTRAEYEQNEYATETAVEA